MDDLLKRSHLPEKHLRILNDLFSNRENFLGGHELYYLLYNENINKLKNLNAYGDILNSIYARKDRQLVLSDYIEYILFGRGYYFLSSKKNYNENLKEFLQSLLYVTNILMCYEDLTTNFQLRQAFFEKLSHIISDEKESLEELQKIKGKIGIANDGNNKSIDNYFDSLLPKTAGGLWHEILTYTFLLKSNAGYIIPLLLTQRLFSFNDYIIPPDFLIISGKNIFGVEVGIKKEIQSGTFSLQTGIPTATLDTINSRNSDRCPICNEWILFCPYVINEFPENKHEIGEVTVNCLNICNIYKKEDILKGKCQYSKFSTQRNSLKIPDEYCNGYHYHYKCVLDKIKNKEEVENILKVDNHKPVIITHFPYYSGLEPLLKRSE